MSLHRVATFAGTPLWVSGLFHDLILPPMSDFADLAAEREELDRTLALRAAHNHAPDLPITGRCHNCDSIVATGHRFCDADCRNDFDARKKAERLR